MKSNEKTSKVMVFWNSRGQIIPHLLYEFLSESGFGLYFPDDRTKKKSDPSIVKVNGNIVSQVNVGYLLSFTKDYILEVNSQDGDAGPILDSLHKSTGLFGDKNLKLLKSLSLNFLSDTKNMAYFFFLNGVVQVSGEGIVLRLYSDFDQYIWEGSIIQMDFAVAESAGSMDQSVFMQFLIDLSVDKDSEKSGKRQISLMSAIGYLLHRYKDPATTKAVIIMDVYVNGQPNGGSGKTLLIKAIGNIRNLSIIDGKQYDQREWFGLSSVELESEILLFDDVVQNFDFEQIFPLMTTGIYIRRKHKSHIFIPFEQAPKVVLTTNYAINGDTSSHRRRKFEFEVSPTYSADYSPRDKFSQNFFSEWDEKEWILFYNTMYRCLQVYLNKGLVEAEPVNLKLAKMINRTSEEFIEWAEYALPMEIQHDKRKLYDQFIKSYPEFNNKLSRRDFTFWLRHWGEYMNLDVSETHSNAIRYITFRRKQNDL